MGSLKHLLVLPITLLLVVYICCGISCSVNRDEQVSDKNVLLSERIIDWSKAGVWHNASDPARPWLGTKGIPDYPVAIIISNTPGSQHYCDPTGAIDCSSNLQAALAACPNHRAVQLPPGKYRVDSSVAIPSFKALRGAGAWQTTIDSRAANGTFTMVESGYNTTGYTLSSGYGRGSKQVVTSGSHPFSVGNLVIIDQENIPQVISSKGGGTCTWCGRSEGGRSMAETLIVTEVKGNTITFHRSLYYNYEAKYSPELYMAARTPIVNAGLEELSIEEQSTQSESMGLRVTGDLYCWMKGVRITGASRFAIRTHVGTCGLEIRRSYIDHASRFENSRGYGIHLLGNTADCLIEDNIFKHNHVHISMEAGGTGNVIGYNYMETTQDINTSWFQTSIMFYGAHPYMNLVEGNVFGKFHASDYFGTSGYQLIFRNHVTRQNPDHYVEYDLNAINVDAGSHYYSFVGNILGYPGMSGENEMPSIPTNQSYPLVWKLGYHANGLGEPVDEGVAATAIRHGNYCYLDDTTRWTDSETRDLQPSLYHNSKPSWFGSLSWPSIGPDVSGYVVDFPARKRWEDYLASRNLRDLF